MTENLSDEELRRLASDPSTPPEALAELAHEHPELQVAIAENPSTYDGLLEWLGEYGSADVAAAIARRRAKSADADPGETVMAAPAAPIELPARIEPSAPPPSPWPTAPARARSGPGLSRRVKASLVVGAAVVVLVALVAGGAYALPALVRSWGPTAATPEDAKVTASDYRFGATRTWQTKAGMVTQGGQILDYAAKVQSYPGLWLVSWPDEGSGSGGVLTEETLLGVDPSTGAVKWSTAPGLFSCASSLLKGGLACADTRKNTLSVLDPATGKATASPLNGTSAREVESYQGDVVFSDEQASGGDSAVDTIERVTADGTVVWKKSATCSEVTDLYGVTILTFDQLDPVAREVSKVGRNGAFLDGACLTGTIDLDSGTIDPNASIGGDDGCTEVSPFPDVDNIFSQGDPCATGSPLIVSRGDSTLTAITPQTYRNELGVSAPPTLWSANLSGAEFSSDGSSELGFAHLGRYALAATAGHLYGLNSSTGPVWEQAGAFTGDRQVMLLPIDESKPDTPVLALDGERNTISRLDPGFGATRVSVEPARLPSCPKGLTPVSFSTWDRGTGATLVCQGFSAVVTVYLILDGTTYTSATGRITPTGYSADFSGGVSVDIGLGGWATWVTRGGSTALHAATSGWHAGDADTTKLPALTDKVEPCPTGTHPLSLSTWNGGWLLTCGTTAQKITRFVFVDGATHGSGTAMTAQNGQSCGTGSSGDQVCVSASPAVVTFQAKGGSPTQHSVDSSYVAGQGFGGAGQGTGAYGLADPQKNAASQVAYLNGILQQSQAARTSIKTVVQNILKCASTQDDVQSAQSVVDARTTELQALSVAPIDALPGGADLVSQLHAALQDSLTADQAYVTAATQVAGGQCPAGRATYAAQADLLAKTTDEKTAFSTAWNSQIAPSYGTPTYTQDDL